MLSKITIEVDFDNQNTPVLQIISRTSDDVRDKLLKNFIEILGGNQWCKIECQGTMPETSVNYDAQKWIISPKSIAGIREYFSFDNKNEKKEYFVSEVREDETENFLGLDIFENGNPVFRWEKPDTMHVDNVYLHTMTHAGERDGAPIYFYSVEINGFVYDAMGKYTIAQIEKRLKIDEKIISDFPKN